MYHDPRILNLKKFDPYSKKKPPIRGWIIFTILLTVLHDHDTFDYYKYYQTSFSVDVGLFVVPISCFLSFGRRYITNNLAAAQNDDGIVRSWTGWLILFNAFLKLNF